VEKTSVIMIGLEPSLIDFSLPAYAAYPGMNADRVLAGIEADRAKLTALGYDVEVCFTDFGETAEKVVRDRLNRKTFDCAMIGAGVRLIAPNTVLFEKLVNVVHLNAPRTKLCFNSGPTDSAEAVQRWFGPTRQG
jgi:hypothetical protein